MPHGPQIALTPQTDERNYPRWDPNAPLGKSGAPYPKMLTKLCTKEDRDAWLERNRQVDPNTRQEFYYEKAPRVGSPIPIGANQNLVDAGFANAVGEPVVIDTKEEEPLILDSLGIGKSEPKPEPKVVNIDIPIAAPVAEEPKDPMAAMKAENARLRAMLQAPQKRKPGRPKKAKPQRLTLEQMAESEE